MQSFKTGHRSDARHRPHHSSPNQNPPRNHNDLTQASSLGAVEGAQRVANLKLLLAKVDGDLAMLSAAAQLKLPGLQQMLEGQSVIGNELATHIEVTLALGQGWLDRKHELSDVSGKTADILHGKDISDFEEEIRRSEQKGLEIMKTTTGSSQNTVAQGANPTRPTAELIEVRVANLTTLTQARGAKSRLARALGVSESIISFLFNGKKEFSNSFSRDFEKALHLPPKWLDSAQTENDVPKKTWDILGSASKPAVQPTPVPSKSLELPNLKLNLNSRPTELQREGGLSHSKPAQATASHQHSSPAAQETAKEKSQGTTAAPKKGSKTHRIGTKPLAQSALTLQLNTSAAPSELLTGARQAELLPELSRPAAASASPAEGTSESQGSADAQASLANPLTAAEPPAVAPSAAKPVPRVPQRQPQQAAAAAQPQQSAHAVPAAASAPKNTASERVATVETTINPDVESPADVLVLSPITEALIKTLTMKAREGRFSEKEAYKLLGQIAEL